MNLYEKDYPCVLFNKKFITSCLCTTLRHLHDIGGFFPCYITPEGTFRGISSDDENIALSRSCILALEDDSLVEVVRHYEEEYHIYIPSKMIKVVELFFKFRGHYSLLIKKDRFYITDLIHSIINSSTYLNGLDL